MQHIPYAIRNRDDDYGATEILYTVLLYVLFPDGATKKDNLRVHGPILDIHMV